MPLVIPAHTEGVPEPVCQVGGALLSWTLGICRLKQAPLPEKPFLSGQAPAKACLPGCTPSPPLPGPLSVGAWPSVLTAGPALHHRPPHAASALPGPACSTGSAVSIQVSMPSVTSAFAAAWQSHGDRKAASGRTACATGRHRPAGHPTLPGPGQPSSADTTRHSPAVPGGSQASCLGRGQQQAGGQTGGQDGV